MRERGYYGEFGGSYIPEILVATFDELVEAFQSAKSDAKFWADAEKGGWRIAVELPEYWHLFFDVEHLMRMGSHMVPGYDYSSWPLMSIRRCWQSQSIHWPESD